MCPHLKCERRSGARECERRSSSAGECTLFMVWSLFSRLGWTSGTTVPTSLRTKVLSTRGDCTKLYSCDKSVNATEAIESTLYWCSVNATTLPPNTVILDSFLPRTHPPLQGTSGHSNTGKLSNVPSVGQRSRFCSHLRYFLLTSSSTDRATLTEREMENRQTELELINKHLLGESRHHSLTSPSYDWDGKGPEKVLCGKKCKLCGANARQRGQYRQQGRGGDARSRIVRVTRHTLAPSEPSYPCTLPPESSCPTTLLATRPLLPYQLPM